MEQENLLIDKHCDPWITALIQKQKNIGIFTLKIPFPFRNWVIEIKRSLKLEKRIHFIEPTYIP